MLPNKVYNGVVEILLEWAFTELMQLFCALGAPTWNSNYSYHYNECHADQNYRQTLFLGKIKCLCRCYHKQ